jgi:DNA-binding HxlR family transcriptional regulator
MDVVAQLNEGGRRYQEIYDGLDGISYKVLTETLRRAERDGLLARHLAPDRVDTATLYELTEIGRSAIVAMNALAEWVDQHWSGVEACRQHWDTTRRGHGANGPKPT